MGPRLKKNRIEQVKDQILKAKQTGEGQTKIQKLQQLLDKLTPNV